MGKLMLNCDMGESIPGEAKTMPFLHMANVACGGHIGDALSMENTCLLAKKHDVKIGAHPSYNDKENFGRKSILTVNKSILTVNKSSNNNNGSSGVSNNGSALNEDVLNNINTTFITQLNDLTNIVKKIGSIIYYVKPHGALNNDMCVNNEILSTVCRSIAQFPFRRIMVPLTARHAEIERIAKSFSLEIIWEVFADRVYENDGTLLSRKKPNAVHSNSNQIITAVKEMVDKKRIKTGETFLNIEMAQSICIHGDNAASLKAAPQIRKILNTSK